MKMNKMIMIAAASLMAGCATETSKCHDRQYLSMTRKYVYSTDQGNLNVYPKTQGPVDTFRPQYKVGDKKMYTTGTGKTEEQALGNALYKMCDALKCDYVAASRCMYTKTEDDTTGIAYEAKLVGFPVYMTGVETIKAKFYEQQADGTLKPAQPEHKTYFSTNLVWKTAALPADEGKRVDSMIPALVEEKTGYVTKAVKCSHCDKVTGTEKCPGK